MPPHRPGRSRRTGSARRPVAALMVLITLLTGCTAQIRRPTENAVQLSVFWWGNARRAQLTEQALRLYSERNPSVTFRVTWQGSTGYYDRLATQAVGGNAPDLFQIDDNYLAEYADRRIVLDLTDLVASKRLDLSGLPPSLAQYGQVDGRTMAVAAAVSSPGLVFNRTLLRRLDLTEPRIGMSYEKYLDWATQVTERSGGEVAGTMDPSADFRALWLWLRTEGKEFYQGRRIGFSVSDLSRWFGMWERARTARAVPSAPTVVGANRGGLTRQLVATGEAAASFVWSSDLPELQHRTDDELAVAAYPGLAGASWARASMFWAGFRGTRHPEVVADVINFLVNDPAAGRILGTERGLSANLDVRRLTEGSLSDPSLRQVANFETEMLDKFGTAPAPPPRGHARIRSLLIDSAESVQLGRNTAQAAASAFINRANAILAS